MRPIRPLLALVVPASLALVLVSCAAGRRSVVLEPREDLVQAAGPTDRAEVFVLEGHEPIHRGQTWGYVSGDSLVLYVARSGQRGGAPPGYRRGGDGAPTAFRREVRRVGEHGLRIAGYTTSDGKYIRYDGYARPDGDSFRFQRRPSSRSLEAREGTDVFQVAASEIRSLEVWIPNVGLTVLGLTVVGLVVLTGAALASFSSSMESAM